MGCRVRRYFNPRSPYGERLARLARFKGRDNYFNPRSPYGERPRYLSAVGVSRYFNPRSPYGERRHTHATYLLRIDFNPRSPYGERPKVKADAGAYCADFNPRSPYGERRVLRAEDHGQLYFNPRSPYGERPRFHPMVFIPGVISIHAPRMGSDYEQCGLLTIDDLGFQSTLPVWGATLEELIQDIKTKFQSTLPVWGATEDRLDGCYRLGDFNPRSPYGERPALRSDSVTSAEFQSTLPVWGATRLRLADTPRRSYFNPRSPYGERRGAFLSIHDGDCISIHAPRMGSDETPNYEWMED